MTKKLFLAAAGIEYVHDVLSRSGTLGHQFKLQVKGRILETGLLSTPSRHEENLAVGGGDSRSKSIIRLASYVRERMQNHGESTLLFDESSRRCDPSLEKIPTVYTMNEEVYHYLPPYSTFKEVRSCIVEAETGSALFGVLFSSEVATGLFLNKRLSKKTIEECSRYSTILIVGVHDGESYLLLPATNWKIAG